MFRHARIPFVATLVLAAAAAHAADRTWHADLEAGTDAARKSGKPVLVVTTWPDGV